jgi:hypothetical protein
VDFKIAVCHKLEQSFLHWKTGIARQFFVKWWDKFDFSRVQSCLHHEYPLKKEALQMIQTIMTQSQQPPEPITEQAPKSESPTSFKGKRHAKKDFKAFAFALAEQFYEQNEENSDEESTARVFSPQKPVRSFSRCSGPL